MTIADERDLPVGKVKVTLADARPELVFNHLTAGSNTMHSIYTPVRVAAALARGQLLQAAADLLGGLPSDFSILDGIIKAPGGQTLSLGSLAKQGAVAKTSRVSASLKPASAQTLVG